MADLIPAGRTSLVKHGATDLQVQTEYAHRPVPRITTTVLRSGRVVQKIERNLDRPITCIEEKNEIETSIRRQHSEIIDIIKNGSQRIAVPAAIPEKPQPPLHRPTDAESKPYPEPASVPPLVERMESLPGKHRVYRLDNEGNFVNAAVSNEFQQAFKPVFKNLHELLSVFAAPRGGLGSGLTRESGVMEVVRDMLYVISTGHEFFIFCLERPDLSIEYERELRALLP